MLPYMHKICKANLRPPLLCLVVSLPLSAAPHPASYVAGEEAARAHEYSSRRAGGVLAPCLLRPNCLRSHSVSQTA